MSETYTRLEVARWLIEEPGVRNATCDGFEHDIYQINLDGLWERKHPNGHGWQVIASPGSWGKGWRRVEPKKSREEALEDIFRKRDLGFAFSFYEALVETFDYLITEREAK